MCGRIWAQKSPEEIQRRCSCPFKTDTTKVRPRFNAGPLSTQHIIVHSSQLEIDVPEACNVLTSMRWGFRNLFTQRKLLLNARYENLGTYYRDFLTQRCILVVDGYFEWKVKKPYAVRPASTDVLMIAGLFRFNEEENEFSVVTCPCSESMFWLHDRQPAIIEEADMNRWLDPTISFNEVSDCLKTPPSTWFTIYEVPELVNSIKNDIPDCLTPAREFSAKQKAKGIIKYFQPIPLQAKKHVPTAVDECLKRKKTD